MLIRRSSSACLWLIGAGIKGCCWVIFSRIGVLLFQWFLRIHRENSYPDLFISMPRKDNSASFLPDSHFSPGTK